MYNDGPEIQRRHENTERYKLASNLVKKLHTAVDENQVPNSQNHIRLNTRRFKHNNNNDKNKQILDNRTNSVKLREEKRKKRRRRQRLIQKCEEGNMKACQKLKIRDHHHNDLNQDNVNSDLVRSLDRRSSRKNGGSKTKSKNKKKLTKAERRERRRKRRERKRQKRRQREKRLKRQQRKREKAEKRKREQDLISNPPRKKRLSDMLKSLERNQNGKCRMKYIDTACDFPHCNPSCPKLVNPKTGKNLFKYFLKIHYY